MQSNIKDLLEQVNKLKALLEDPQEGLLTWNQFVRERILNIAKFAGLEDKK